jgi:myo-inositol 2-dehydrogenase/D-chiro-inositol 1-dehydrogenase
MTLRVGVVGVVGAGAMGATHAEAWRGLGAHVALHSRRPPTELADQLGATVAPTFDDLLGSVDLVDICTPTPTHPDLVRAAVAAGRPVVCEKPLARTAADAADLAEAADAAGVLLVPAHVVRFFAAYRRLHRAIQTGELGTVSTAHFTRQVAAPATGTWFRDDERSGGVVLDLMLHDLDQALWHFGPVDEVTASSLGAGDDSVRARLVHTSGVTTTVEATWGPQRTAFATTFSVVGDDGTMTSDSRREPAQTDSPYLDQLREVRRAVETGSPVRVSARDGVEAVALAERVLDAVRE